MSAPATTGFSRPRGLHVLVTSGVAALAPGIRRKRRAHSTDLWSIAVALLNRDAGVNIDRSNALYDTADVRPALLFGDPCQLVRRCAGTCGRSEWSGAPWQA